MLSNSDLRLAIEVVRTLSGACGSRIEFARTGVTALSKIVSADLTHLSLCDLDTHHRNVVSNLPGAIGNRELEAFDHYFDVHPLVRAHGRNAHAITQRITDIMSGSDFRRTPVYNEYYRVIGIEHAMSCPFHVDGRYLTGFVLNRSGGRGFSSRDRDLLDLIRPHLSNLYRLSIAFDASGTMPACATRDGNRPLAPRTVHLTDRERQVLGWLAAGKTSRDIGAILGNSKRTVEKHLENIYEKLGVETRTAAVMRWNSIRQYSARPLAALERLGE